MSRRTTFLAALAAAVLTASAAGARNLTPLTISGGLPAAEHRQTAPRETTGSVGSDLTSRGDLAPGRTRALWLHGVLGCAPTTAGLNCRQTQRLLAK